VAAVPSGLSLTPLRIKKKEPCYMFLVEWWQNWFGKKLSHLCA
jgi:hypothetical protein